MQGVAQPQEENVDVIEQKCYLFSILIKIYLVIKKQWRVTMTVILSIELVKLLKNQTLMKIDGMNVQKEYISLLIGKKQLNTK